MIRSCQVGSFGAAVLQGARDDHACLLREAPYHCRMEGTDQRS